MSKWERLEATVQQEPTDRVPWALWRHFYERETSAEGLAQAMLDWQRRHDFDLLKVNPRAEYHAEAWGARFRFSGKPTVKPTAERLPVNTVGDWLRIETMPPTVPAFDEQLRAISLIRRGLGGTVPFVQTVFTPLAVAGYLIGDEQRLLRHLREEPDAVHQALHAISDSFAAYVSELLNAGVSGIFLATTAWATTDMLTEAEYDTFGRPYDLQVLAAAAEARLNVLHVCRGHSMLKRLLDYPVQVVNWAVGEDGNASLGEIADTVRQRAVAGGLSDAALTAQSPDRALREATQAADQARNRGLLLSGNCSIPVTASETVLDAVHRWVLQR